MAATHAPFDPGFLLTPSDTFSLGCTVSPQYKTSLSNRQTDRRHIVLKARPIVRSAKNDNILIYLWNNPHMSVSWPIRKFAYWWFHMLPTQIDPLFAVLFQNLTYFHLFAISFTVVRYKDLLNLTWHMFNFYKKQLFDFCLVWNTYYWYLWYWHFG